MKILLRMPKNKTFYLLNCGRGKEKLNLIDKIFTKHETDIFLFFKSQIVFFLNFQHGFCNWLPNLSNC